MLCPPNNLSRLGSMHTAHSEGSMIPPRLRFPTCERPASTRLVLGVVVQGFPTPCSTSQPIDRPQTRPAQTRAIADSGGGCYCYCCCCDCRVHPQLAAHGSLRFESSALSTLGWRHHQDHLISDSPAIRLLSAHIRPRQKHCVTTRQEVPQDQPGRAPRSTRSTSSRTGWGEKVPNQMCRSPSPRKCQLACQLPKLPLSLHRRPIPT